MNADAFRHFYEYHFAENRKIWEAAMQLSDPQFAGHVEYSRGSVQDQILHLINCDAAWFSGLRNVEYSQDVTAADFGDRASIRAHWDSLEQQMRAYLGTLRDEMLFDKPFPEHEEDKDLILWQVLLHVINHGTDHRAQLLRLLNDLGVTTSYQDYIFYVYEHPLTDS